MVCICWTYWFANCSGGEIFLGADSNCSMSTINNSTSVLGPIPPSLTSPAYYIINMYENDLKIIFRNNLLTVFAPLGRQSPLRPGIHWIYLHIVATVALALQLCQNWRTQSSWHLVTNSALRRRLEHPLKQCF